MSRYLVNKFVHLVNSNPQALDEYRRDREGFVDRWQTTQELQLSAEERTALVDRDYGRLYQMGAHPFILWSFTRAVYEHERPVPDLIAEYKATTDSIGYPDFRT